MNKDNHKVINLEQFNTSSNLKIDRGFFERRDINVLESIPGGKEMILFYIKLVCICNEHNGKTHINFATGEVHMFDEEEAEAYISANIDDLESNVSSAKSLLATIQDKTVTIKSVFQTVKEGAKGLLGIGNHYATGTDYAPPGAHWVGENGPELLWFNGGEKVLNARDSAALVNNYSKMAQIQKILDASDNDNQDVLSAVEGISSFSDVHMSAFQPQLSASAYQEPVSAMQSSERPEYKIEIKNEFIIEGTASEETIAALENWGEKFREIVRDEFAEILENNHRSTYI